MQLTSRSSASVAQVDTRSVATSGTMLQMLQMLLTQRANISLREE